MSQENPYASPVSAGPAQPKGESVGRLLGQVKAIAICSIVQDALEMLMAGFLLATAFMMAYIMDPQAGVSSPPEVAEQVERMRTYWLIYNGVVGGLVFLAGALRLVAGIQNLRLRGRALGLSSFFVGLLGVATCYCKPTAIGLLVWGCIVYFNQSVAQAFRLRQQGMSVADIRAQAYSVHGAP